MEQSKVSSDAMPALTGRRCVGTVAERSAFAGKQGGTAEFVFLSLFPQGNKDFFIPERSIVMRKKLPGKRWRA